MKACAPPPRPILHWRPYLGTEWHRFVRVSTKRYESKGLVPSPHLVETLSEYAYRVEPVGGNAGLPG